MRVPHSNLSCRNATSTAIWGQLHKSLPRSIDDRPTDAKLTRRVFVTPALQRGAEFTYALKAEIVRDGQSVVTTRQVAVRGGQQTFVRLVFPALEVTATEIVPPE